MIRLNWLKKVGGGFRTGALLSGAIVALSGLLQTFPSKNYSPGAIRNILFLNESITWLVVPLFSGITAFFTYLRTHFGTTSTWGTVTALLEHYREAAFRGRDGFTGAPSHHNRVTLYKFCRFRWWVPWWHWMVPVARTGHTTHTWKIPRFRAPIGNPDAAEGVAGQAFVNKNFVEVNNLPQITPESTNEEVAEYSRKGFVQVKWVDKKKGSSCSIRSLVGVPIEVKGEVWGAIVIDSRHPAKIKDIQMMQESEFQALGRLLSKILEN